MRTDVKVTVYTVHVFNIVHNELNTFKCKKEVEEYIHES